MEFEPFLETDDPPKIPLPKGWPKFARVAILHVIALARLAIMHARCWPDGSENDTLRLRSELERALSDNAMLRMELEIKDARLAAIDPHRRPNYTPSQRLQILRLRAARGWNKSQLARRFHVTIQTMINWTRALNEGDPLVGDHDEVKPTRYPDYLRMLIQQVKAFFPLLGRGKIADMLGRASLHISGSTVGRIIKEAPIDPASVEQPDDDPDEDSELACDESDDGESPREIIANYPDHVYSIDLTEVPIGDGFWVPWSPHAIHQQWPYCWHVLTLIDHYSRRVIGFRVFHKQPNRRQVANAMTEMTRAAGVKPKHIVADRGEQFDCEIFHEWCRKNKVKWRHGAIGQHGSIAVIERFHRTLKSECTRRIIVSNVLEEFVEELQVFVEYYNGERVHSRHDGKTPNEVYFNLPAANAEPRFEPRPRARDHTPCARPRTKIDTRAGAKVRIEVSFYKGR